MGNSSAKEMQRNCRKIIANLKRKKANLVREAGRCDIQIARLTKQYKATKKGKQGDLSRKILAKNILQQRKAQERLLANNAMCDGLISQVSMVQSHVENTEQQKELNKLFKDASGSFSQQGLMKILGDGGLNAQKMSALSEMMNDAIGENIDQFADADDDGEGIDDLMLELNRESAPASFGSAVAAGASTIESLTGERVLRLPDEEDDDDEEADELKRQIDAIEN